jgi:hypothetical protein
VPPAVPTPWGEVPIPDDASALAEETADVRRELRRARWRRLWTQLLGPGNDPDGPGIVGPLLAVALAVMIGVGSLFGGFWPYQSDDMSGGTRLGDVPKRLPDLVLTDPHGRPVRLAGIRPSVILSVTRCLCTDLITQAAAMTRRRNITLVVVDRPSDACLPPSVASGDPGSVLCLTDPHGVLLGSIAPTRPPRDGTAMVVLVATDGTMTQVLADVDSAHQFAPGLDRLG